jgi:hypothetical protein
LLRFQVRARFRLNRQKVTGLRVEQDDIADNGLPADPDRHLQRGHRPACIRQRRWVQAVGERQVEDGVDRYEPGFHLAFLVRAIGRITPGANGGRHAWIQRAGNAGSVGLFPEYVTIPGPRLA